jgi:hypothetical protein
MRRRYKFPRNDLPQYLQPLSATLTHRSSGCGQAYDCMHKDIIGGKTYNRTYSLADRHRSSVSHPWFPRRVLQGTSANQWSLRWLSRPRTCEPCLPRKLSRQHTAHRSISHVRRVCFAKDQVQDSHNSNLQALKHLESRYCNLCTLLSANHTLCCVTTLRRTWNVATLLVLLLVNLLPLWVLAPIIPKASRREHESQLAALA